MKRPAARGRVGLFALSLFLVLDVGRVEAQEPPKLVLTSDQVIQGLNRTLSWYQEVRVGMRMVNDSAGPLFAREEEQMAVRIVQRSFEAARAEAALLATSQGAPESGPARPQGASTDRRAQIEADIGRDQEEMARLRARLPTTPARERTALAREVAAASNRLELNRLRLDFITKLQQLDTDAVADDDLAHQIQALQDTVPELRPSGEASEIGAQAAPQAVSVPGTWGLIRRVLTLERTRSSLKAFTASTSALTRSADAELHATESVVRPIIGRLRALAKDPSTTAAPFETHEREFRDLLDRAKLLGAVVVPLRSESALLHRFATDLQGTRSSLDRAAWQTIEGLAFQLAGVVLAIAGILIGSVLWRVAASRYLSNPYHHRLALTLRNVAVAGAIVLVLVFHFTSELTALVTALGFAAAGIAFALQNVILSAAGYFSMVAPNGIRVGDRVSLQGPFGYVNGEVLEIGFVRMRLRELADSPLQPTGRTVVFPNSVVFTGSFFKHPRGEAAG